jgi:two-component system response regulator
MPYRPILLVEDDPDAVTLTLLALTKNKIHNQTTVARDGAEALEHLFGHADASQEPPALILLDLNLPKLDGFQVLRLIRAHDRTRLIPVVILTSSTQEEDILAGYQAGANAYVCKPVNFTDFTSAIGALCAFWLLVSEPPPDAVSPAASSAPSAKRDLVHPAMAEADPARPARCASSSWTTTLATRNLPGGSCAARTMTSLLLSRTTERPMCTSSPPSGRT